MNRKLKKHEHNLLQLLLEDSKAIKKYAPNGLDFLLVTDMDDGGMGSLRFEESGEDNEDRRMASRIAEKQFTDTDGVPILVSLNIDQNGKLYEMDIWKTDFSKLLKYPEN